MVRTIRIVALATLWIVPTCIFSVAFSSGWISTWREVRLPSMTPHFVDLYSIPTAIETMHSGIDPLVSNAADPYKRPMNYPRIWLYLFSAAGITRANISIVALLFCALYLSCVSFMILQSQHPIDMVLLTLSGLSLAPLFAMERGNNDMAVFALIFLGCVVTNGYLKSGAFGLSALLKLYPMAAMMFDAIRRPAKQRPIAITITGLVLIVLLLQWKDLVLIRQNTPISRVFSYGVFSLRDEVISVAMHWGVRLTSGWILIVECWIAAALAMAYGWGSSWEITGGTANPVSGELFAAFGSVYAFTFAIGSNWDYRLILLLPTLPFVLEMARGSAHRIWAGGYVVCVILAENGIGFEESGGRQIVHLATLALFLMTLIPLAGECKKYLLKSDRPILARA